MMAVFLKASFIAINLLIRDVRNEPRKDQLEELGAHHAETNPVFLLPLQTKTFGSQKYKKR